MVLFAENHNYWQKNCDPFSGSQKGKYFKHICKSEYQIAIDSGKSAPTKHNLALAYNVWDMILKNRPKLETGVPASSAEVGFI